MLRDTCLRPSKSQRRAGSSAQVMSKFSSMRWMRINCFFGGPVFVAVDEESGSVGCDAEGFLHDADASEVGLHVESDFELATVDASLGHSSVEGEDGVVVEAEVDAAGVGFGAAFAGAEGLPERFVGDLCFEVPEGGVDGVDGGVHLAFVSAFKYEVDESHP